MGQNLKTLEEAILARKNHQASLTDTKRKRNTKNPVSTNGNTRLTWKRRARRQSLGRSLRSERNENGRRTNHQPQLILNEDRSQSLLEVAALHQDGGAELRMIPSGDPFLLRKEPVARRMTVEVVAVLKITVGGSTKVSLQLHPASGELAPNTAAGLASGANPVVEMRRVMLLLHTGCTRSLHLSTVRRRRKKRKMKIRAVSILVAVLDLAVAIPHTDPPGVLTQAARMLLQTRAAIVDSTVTLMTAIVTTVTDHEGTPSALMIQMTQTMPAPNTGPNGTNTHHLMMTIASAAASPEADLGVILGSDQDPGAEAAAAVEATVEVREVAAPRPTAGSEAGVIAGTGAAAPGALPRDQVPERDHGVMRAQRRGALAIGISSAQRSTALSLPTISGQVGAKVLERKKMAEEMTVKEQAFPPRIAILAQEGDQKVTAALKIRILLLPDCY